jgi:hypothetical protein
MAKKLPTFEVDKQGLAKLLERKGKQFAVAELIQNAWDENVSRVSVTLREEEPADSGGSIYRLEVEDDSPEGFADIAHAYTLFADSKKKDDPEKRGRFNIGEKLVIAMCQTAVIETTKGIVRFTPDGREMDDSQPRKAGSIFRGFVQFSDEEAKAVERLVNRLIPPAGVTTTFNGVELAHREPVREFEISLRTERADSEGFLRPTTRKTRVAIYQPSEGEVGQLYEMGIPVVESGDTYHVDIAQKVPLNTDRDNVPPSFLRDVRAAVLNATHELLTPAEAGETWVDHAIEDETVTEEAVQSVVSARYGDKAVIADPSDREAEKIAVSKGFTVIPAGAFSKAAWKSVKGAEAVKPAGQVTPSPDPSAGEDKLDIMDPEHWPSAVTEFAAYAKELAAVVLGVAVNVRVVQPKNRSEWPYNATWGRRSATTAELTLNYTALGYSFFEKAVSGPVCSVRAHELLIHEFAHQDAPEHLSEAFYDACCKVGARLAAALADEPDLLEHSQKVAA